VSAPCPDSQTDRSSYSTAYPGSHYIRLP
jgi:hypothetical protein